MRKVKEVKSTVHFPEHGSSLSLKVFTDAAHGNFPDGFSSTMGLVVFLAGNGRVAPVSWRANKIRLVVKSSLTAEALALQERVDEAVYIQQMLSEMGLQVSIHAFVDNRNRRGFAFDKIGWWQTTANWHWCPQAISWTKSDCGTLVSRWTSACRLPYQERCRWYTFTAYLPVRENRINVMQGLTNCK